MYQRFQRLNRLFKILCVVTAVLLLGTVGFYIWFVSNATRVLERMVHDKSKGALTLEIRHLRFNFFTRTLSVRQATLFSTDTTQRAVTYNVVVPRLAVRVPSVWDMAVHGNLQLDSIQVNKPTVTIVKRFNDTTKATTVNTNGLSITEEIGNVYYSLRNGLESFGIERVVVHDAGFRMEDRTQPLLPPTAVSRVNLDLIRGAAVATNDTVDHEQLTLNVQHQNIAMPNGRYRLAFRNFKLQLFDKRVLLDSCTLYAVATDSAHSSYAMFFDTVLLAGVDFGAMYRNDELRADSVYCVSPVFDIHIDNTQADSTKVPDPAKLIREFTSDMSLAYVAVKNAGVRLDVKARHNRAQVNSNADNFELRGLRVNADSVVPVAVQRFDLRVSNYQLFNRDSTTSYAFDSVHFHDDQIALTNFVVSTTSSPSRPRNERNFDIPYFELTGLDWYQLIFEQNLRARAAVLRNADITYNRTLPVVKPQKHRDLLASMQTLDSLVTLDRLSIQNGRVNIKLAHDQSFVFEDVNMFVNTNQMLKASGVSGLRSSVKQLSFTDGRIRYKDLTAQLEDVTSEEGLLYAGKLRLIGKDSTIKATASDVYIGDVLLDNKSENVMVDGLRWSAATVNVNALPTLNANNKSNDRVEIKNVSGNNTRVTITGDSLNAQTFVTSLSVASLTKDRNEPMRIEGLEANGNALAINKNALHVKADGYKLSDDASTVTGLSVERNRKQDSLLVKIPRVAFNANVNALASNDMRFASIDAQSPDVTYISFVNEALEDSVTHVQDLRIDRLVLKQPNVHIGTRKKDTLMDIRMPQTADGLVDVSNLVLDSNGTTVGKISVNTSDVSLRQSAGANVSVNNGKLLATLYNTFVLARPDTTAWRTSVDTLYLQNLVGNAVGKKIDTLRVDSLSLGSVRLSSANTKDWHKMIRDNARMRLGRLSGRYADTVSTFDWYNVAYDRAGSALQLDSFRYRPTRSRDYVIEHAPYQLDYVTLHTGAIRISGIDIPRFEKDTALFADNVDIRDPVITAFRDKKPPFQHGIVKPLPVDMVRRVPFPVDVQRVNLYGGTVAYTERNAKSRAEGTVTLNSADAVFLNIKNHDVQADDSMFLMLNARLMDSAMTHVRVKEAYVDTLSSFRMTVNMGPTAFNILNPVLAPLMNVAVASGRLDTFSLHAVGREYQSIGEAKMFYRDLRVLLVSGGDPNKRPLLKRLVTLYVNAFLIKNENHKRTGIVYFERDRGRSFFNYIWKMTLSGMATSTGVKKNKNFLQNYRRNLIEKEQPPMDFELSDPHLQLPVPTTKR